MSNSERIAFVGAGIIAEVWIERLIRRQRAAAQDILACDPRKDQLTKLHERWGIATSPRNRDGAEFADLVVLATPPAEALRVVDEMRPALSRRTLIVSLAAAVGLELLEGAAGDAAVVRVMPNTPSLVGEGMNLVAFGTRVDTARKERLIRLLEVLGWWREVPDAEMNQWCALCAVGPTYFYPLITALAEAAAASGLATSQALDATAQVAAGAARMIQQSGRAPGELQRMVSLRTLPEEDAAHLLAGAYAAALHKLRTMEGKLSEERQALPGLKE